MKGTKVLILVPHQDDEINVAGNTIANFFRMGAEIHVCYSTNGDYEVPASIRIQEAINSLKKLGCNVENIHFLGYADSLNNNPNGHIFYDEEKVVESKSGHTETYGWKQYKDYRFTKTGSHSKYNSKSYNKDLKELILDIRANIIICVDLDTHADHRMLSLSFDKVMGEILKTGIDYHPLVLKRFAYPLAYFAPQDFYSLNLKSTLKPTIDYHSYPQDLIDTSYYDWNQRLRLPVIKGEYNHFLSTKMLTQALSCHKSQSAIFKASGIINGDEVFFIRRTDSLSYKATVNVSSGNGEMLNDFQSLNTKNIDDKNLVFDDYLWRPDYDDERKEASFSWDSPVDISYIRIYGNIEGAGTIEKIRIIFDNRYYLDVGPLPMRGRPLDIMLETHYCVSNCKIIINEIEGTEYGISKCEFYTNHYSEVMLPPLLKILIEDDFVYKYYIDYIIKSINISSYFFMNKQHRVRYKVINGDAIFFDGKIIFGKSKLVVLRAELIDNPEIYDQVIIERLHSMQILFLRSIQMTEEFFLHCFSRLMRKSNFLKNKFKGMYNERSKNRNTN